MEMLGVIFSGFSLKKTKRFRDGDAVVACTQMQQQLAPPLPAPAMKNFFLMCWAVQCSAMQCRDLFLSCGHTFAVRECNGRGDSGTLPVCNGDGWLVVARLTAKSPHKI